MLPQTMLSSSVTQLDMLALDVELTSLSLATAGITSVGWVAGKGATMSLGSAFYAPVSDVQELAQSPVIHGLTPQQLNTGKPLKQVFRLLEPLLRSHVVLCHNSALDIGILAKMASKLGLAPLTITAIDTMLLEKYLLEKRTSVLHTNALTLAQCRQRYHFSPAPQHHALDDALATYQLWLAQAHQLNCTKNTQLADLLHTGAVVARKIENKLR